MLDTRGRRHGSITTNVAPLVGAAPRVGPLLAIPSLPHCRAVRLIAFDQRRALLFMSMWDWNRLRHDHVTAGASAADSLPRAKNDFRRDFVRKIVSANESS